MSWGEQYDRRAALAAHVHTFYNQSHQQSGPLGGQFTEGPDGPGREDVKGSQDLGKPGIATDIDSIAKEIQAQREKEGKKPLAESSLRIYASKEAKKRKESSSETTAKPPAAKTPSKDKPVIRINIKTDDNSSGYVDVPWTGEGKPTQADVDKATQAVSDRIQKEGKGIIKTEELSPAPMPQEAPKERGLLKRLFTKDTPYEQAQQELRREADKQYAADARKARSEAAAAERIREAPAKAAAKAQAKKDRAETSAGAAAVGIAIMHHKSKGWQTVKSGRRKGQYNFSLDDYDTPEEAKIALATYVEDLLYGVDDK